MINSEDVTTGIHTRSAKQVAVDMDIVAEYGKDIETIYDQMKEVITREVQQMTHLEVIEVNVNVVDIKTQAGTKKKVKRSKINLATPLKRQVVLCQNKPTKPNMR